MSETVHEFLTSGEVAVYNSISSSAWIGYILAVEPYGFLMVSSSQENPPIFVPWSIVQRITQVEKSR